MTSGERFVRKIRGRLCPPASVDEFDLGDEIASAIAASRDHTMLSLRGAAALYQQVAHLDREAVTGAIVECGVWHGGSAAIMARASMAHRARSRRALCLFDSFKGIPEPDSTLDGERAVREVGGMDRAGGRLRVAWDYSERGGPGSPTQVRALLDAAGWDLALLHIHEGWFQETVPAARADIGPIAMLHLDGDWYESTKVCLEHLYPQVAVGGLWLSMTTVRTKAAGELLTSFVMSCVARGAT